MVLKHAPLGEINLPFVASSANAPRCRRQCEALDSFENRRSFRVGVIVFVIVDFIVIVD
jgi:hypothetical protein